MFTGIVEEIGKITKIEKSCDSLTLHIHAAIILTDTKIGDSISVNGVCLTVTHIDDRQFTVGLAPETIQRTTLGQVSADMRVNLERAVTPTTRLGGHYVQGHIDQTGVIKAFRQDADALWVTITTPKPMMRYMVAKGYIAIDGTSLTIVDVGPDWFNVTLVAHTQHHITLPKKSIGDKVNLEVDIMAKYVERALLYMEGV